MAVLASQKKETPFAIWYSRDVREPFHRFSSHSKNPLSLSWHKPLNLGHKALKRMPIFCRHLRLAVIILKINMKAQNSLAKDKVLSTSLKAKINSNKMIWGDLNDGRWILTFCHCCVTTQQTQSKSSGLIQVFRLWKVVLFNFYLKFGFKLIC